MDLRLTGLELKTSLRAITDLVLPRSCVVCGSALRLHESYICTGCRSDLPETGYSLREHNPMADKFNEMVRCEGYEPYAYAAALFFYNSESPYRRIPPFLKYYRGFDTGKYFAGLLGDRLAASALFRDVDAVVPVPLHWTRRLSRGYNQAEVIASEVARRLPSAILCPGALRRVRRTGTQTRLSVRDKRSNVEGAFCPFKAISDPSHILLVDDVFTTGSTVAACHSALRTVYSPDVRISVATLAFVSN